MLLDRGPQEVEGGSRAVARVSGRVLPEPLASRKPPLPPTPTPTGESTREHRTQAKETAACLLLGEPTPAFLEQR